MTEKNATYRKKLIEVALPLDAINEACRKDKGIKTGHIRNIHKWFAPMPLPAWRAILFASLLDDPGCDLPPEDASRERNRLFRIIKAMLPAKEFKTEAIQNARDELAKKYPKEMPTVVDPFCGGGSTIVEAQRLGLPCVAADLNPVPVAITMALCSIPPLVHGAPSVSKAIGKARLKNVNTGLYGFISDVTHYAGIVRNEALKKIGAFYPAGSNNEKIVAWRWAWSVPSPDPAANDCYTPLVTNWWLSKGKSQGNIWINPRVNNRLITYEISSEGPPPPPPTIGRSGGRCLYTGNPISLDYIRTIGQRGRMRPTLLAMIGIRDGKRVPLPATDGQAAAAHSLESSKEQLLLLPDVALGFRVQKYGQRDWSDLFTGRQFAAMSAFADAVRSTHKTILDDAIGAGWHPNGGGIAGGGKGARAYADAVALVLGLCVGRLAQSNCVQVRWFIDPRNGSGKPTPAFGQHVLRMVWDFVETNPFGSSTGGWQGPVTESALRAFGLTAGGTSAVVHVTQSDARELSVDADSYFVATDPPYYDNVGYADLSDFFYIWLRKSLGTILPEIMHTLATPKHSELVADQARHDGDKEAANVFYQNGFTDAFKAVTARMNGDIPISIIYALKQSESDRVGATGWEVFLKSLIDAGLQVTATWPINTSATTRMRGQNSNALATAICVTCRRRLSRETNITRRVFRQRLRDELPGAMAELQHGNIAPVDVAQSAIGPGMAIFSRYEKVLEADGSPMTVRTALQLINEALDEYLTEQEGELDSDSRFAVTWFEQHGYDDGAYGDAETLAKARNVSVSGVADAGILKSAAGKVRLLRRDDLPADWDPAKDERLTVWEATQHLIKRLEEKGEEGAARLLNGLGPLSEQIRDLAYRLYSSCERRKWAEEARAYNGLVIAWPEVERLASQLRQRSPEQATMEF